MQIIMCYISVNQRLYISLSWGIVLQHTMIGTHYYDMPWSNCSFTTCPGRYTVLRHVLVGTQFYNMQWSGHRYTAYLGRDIVLYKKYLLNDFASVSKKCVHVLFADDINIFLNGKYINKLVEIIQSELFKLCNWLQINKLTLNLPKTHFMVSHK